MVSIGIYHGDEDWVLKGIGIDLSKALEVFPDVAVKRTDQVFKGRVLDSDCHVFVQQGQFYAHCKRNNGRVLKNSVCLFTHLDIANFCPELLSKCKRVIFNSSVQLSMAIANGYDSSNAVLQPHAVDPSLHRIFSNKEENVLRVLSQLRSSGKQINLRSAVGFCGRYWDKSTYVRRKNYQKVKELALKLADSQIPVVVLGPGWDNLFGKRADSHPYLALVQAKYSIYPYIYNMMKVFVSLSVHEGGPFPLLESMCCGVYPVATNTGFAFDVLRDHKDGVLIDPFRDVGAYYDIIVDKYYSECWDSFSLRERASSFSFKALAALVYQNAFD